MVKMIAYNYSGGGKIIMTLLMRIMRQSLLNLKPLSILLVEGQNQIGSVVRIMQFNSRQHLGRLVKQT